MGTPKEDEMTAIPKPRFDATLNWGHVVIVLTFIVTAASQWYLTDYRLRALEESFKDSFKSLSNVVVNQALSNERIDQLYRRVDRLETRP